MRRVRYVGRGSYPGVGVTQCSRAFKDYECALTHTGDQKQMGDRLVLFGAKGVR